MPILENRRIVRTIDTGAPVMETSGRVLSGNNRTLALMEMQGEEGGKAEIYEKGARAEAAALGLNPESFAGRPVGLFRVVEPGLSGRSREQFVEQTNTAAVEQLSEADKAAKDREVLSAPGLLESLDPLEDGRFNTDFLHAFDRALGSPKELRKPDGGIDLAKVERRAQAALISHLLGNGPGADSVLVSLLSNLATPGIKSVVGALAKAGPAVLHIAAINPALDIAPNIGRALTTLLDYRRALDSGEVKNVEDFLGQGHLFAADEKLADPLDARILEKMATARSVKALSDPILRYAKAVEDYGDPGQERLFGPAVPPDPVSYLASQRTETRLQSQPSRRIGEDEAEMLWNVAQAEPAKDESRTQKQWALLYKKLFALEKSGVKLAPEQRSMLEKAEAALGQKLMFGDEVKGTPDLPTFKAKWETGGLKGENAAQQEGLFDERGTVGRMPADQNQGVLFSQPATRPEWLKPAREAQQLNTQPTRQLVDDAALQGQPANGQPVAPAELLQTQPTASAKPETWTSEGSPAERVQANLARADALAQQFANIPGIEMDDVRQHARMALAKASRAYDESKGDFGPWARTIIRNDLKSLYQERVGDRNLPILDEPLPGSQDGTETGNSVLPDETADVGREVAASDAGAVLDRVWVSCRSGWRSRCASIIWTGAPMTRSGRKSAR